MYGISKTGSQAGGPANRPHRSGAGRPERGPGRPRHDDSSNTGPTGQRLGLTGRSWDLTRTTEKTDSDGGDETGKRADNMESRSTGTKGRDATWQGP